MFRPNANRVFQRQVEVFTPREDDATKFDKGVFIGVFKQLSESRIAELENEPHVRFLDEVMIGALKIDDGTGHEMSPEEGLKVVKDDSCAAAAARRVYLESTIGKNARVKN